MNRSGLVGVLAGAGLLGGGATLCGFAGRFGWLFELASHFRVQYGLGLALIAALLALLGAYRLAACGVLFAALNLVLLLPYYVGGVAGGAVAGPDTVRALLLNVNTHNTQYQRVRDLIETYAPDLVLLIEADAAWLRQMDDLRRAYPHTVAESRADNFGIALFSRLPLKQARIAYLGEAEVPSIVAEIEAGDRVFNLVGIHPPPPMTPQQARRRNDQLAALGEWIADNVKPTVLLGDLNITPWSPYFGRLLRTAGLRDSARGRGIQPTWPAGYWPLLIPIDHFLYSEGIAVHHRQTGPAVGSDHYPVVVDFSITASPPPRGSPPGAKR